MTRQITGLVVPKVVLDGDVSSRISKLKEFFKGDVNKDTPRIMVAFKNQDNGTDGELVIFGILQEPSIKCGKNQVTDYEVNNEKFQTVISRGEMYVKVRVMTPRDSEHNYHIIKKAKVKNFLLLSFIDPPSWTDCNRHDYIVFTEQGVTVSNPLIIYKIDKTTIE